MEQQLFIGYLGVFFILLSKDLLALWLLSKLPASGEEVTDGFGLMCSGIPSGAFVIAPMGVVTVHRAFRGSTDVPVALCLGLYWALQFA